MLAGADLHELSLRGNSLILLKSFDTFAWYFGGKGGHVCNMHIHFVSNLLPAPAT